MKVFQMTRSALELSNHSRLIRINGSEKYDEIMFGGIYHHVANIKTDDMDVAFEVMNLWNNDDVIEILEHCYSMSVGDILELDDGSRFMVDPFGFEKIN